jgi:poly(A) polymerase
LKDAPWLRDGALARLLDILGRDGEEARVVGGAVRNALLGEPIHEFDIATTLAPIEVMRRASDAGFKPVPTGIEHGTITVVIDSKPFEVTTLREDVETFGRHASVRFGRDWEADAQRRDFTINALSVGIDGVVHDTVGGLADLEARRVRFIGDPNKRIEEDYLRILRFFRFHAAYGRGVLDADGLAACIARRGGIAFLSRERVRMELLKLLIAPHAAPALAAMAEAGLLVPVLGGVPDLAGFENMAKAEAAANVQADAVQRLTALAARIPEDAERLHQRLRLSNAEHERIASMADGWWRVTPGDEQASRALLYRLGPQRFADRVLLAWARSWAPFWETTSRAAHDATWRTLFELPAHWAAPVFPLKAADFIKRGVSQGPALGAALREAEEAWIAADFPSDSKALAAIADAAAGEVRPM